MTSTPSAVGAQSPAQVHVKRAVGVTLGALAVALAAQFSVPLPGTPVPMTLQPLAVLIVGGLLGPGAGALSLVVYLGMGAMGLPVFTPGGMPGLARLLGPTGGYLVAYPAAAWLVGWVVRRDGGTEGRGDGPTMGPSDLSAVPSYTRAVLAALAGIVTIHVGGAAQLIALTGSAGSALAMGVVPFVAGDLLKVAVAALVIRRLLPSSRALS